MMFDIKRIKLPKFIVKTDQKGWFKGYGLHHASLTVLCILLFSMVGMGGFGAAFAVGWYASREYGNGPYPPAVFEVFDFVSPLMVALIYNLVF